MKLRILPLASLFVLAFAAGCSGADDTSSDDSSTEDLSKAPVATFAEDGTFGAPTHPLRAGQTLVLKYPIAGRAVCPDGGEESILGSFSVDGGAAAPAFFLGSPTADGRFYTAKIRVPHGHHLAVWFFRQDITRHVTCFDSNGGSNFVLPIAG